MACTSSAHAASSVRVVRDVKVPTSGGKQITIDVWRPTTRSSSRGRSGRKVALLVHGGGWHTGDKRQWEQSRWAQRLARNGWLVVNANYRLACPASSRAHSARDTRLCGHAMRDSIADVRSALRYTSRRARAWGGDPRHIVLFGASAGAHLAMLAGSDRNRPNGVRAVVAIGPPTNLMWVGRRPTIPLYASALQSIGCSLEQCPAAWRAASPIVKVRRGTTPPTWIFTARRDPITSIVPVRHYLRQLKRHKVPYRFMTTADSTATCHGPIPCANERIAGGGSRDMFQHALAWASRYA